MAQINIKYTTGSNVENPTTDQVAVFTSGSLGSSSLYLKESDGTIITVGSGSGGGGGVGPQGSQGPTGPQGNQGNQGITGASGSLGPQGNQGNQGPLGLTGPQGNQGNQGPLGPQGNQGNQGPTGADSNVAGPQGNQGPLGPQGNQGPTGADSNVAGPQGNQGPLGPQGNQGNQGPTGADSNVVGPQGNQGNQGPLGLTGPQGNQGNQGPLGPQGNQGNQGPTGADSTVAGPTGPQGNQGNQGPLGPQGADGSGGGGASYNPMIRYVADSDTSDQIEILSSGNVEGGLSWTRSSTTLTVTHTSHGLSAGDYVVIRNMSADYSYLEIQTVPNVNSFTLTVADSGGTSGSEGAYIPAAKATSVTDDGCTISAPSAGNIQILSIKVVTGTKSGTTYNLVMPTSLTNGAGANSSLINQNPPILQAYKLSDGANIGGASITVNTSSNFNQFQAGGLNQLINLLLKFTF